MTAERIVSNAIESPMNWRQWYGLAPKPTYRCEWCGVETTKGKRCKYHSNARRNRAYWFKSFLCACVDEARAET